MVAYKSKIDVNGNTFKNMKCTDCSGLILSIINCSSTKVKNNLFESNSAREATCVYIEKSEI